VKRDLAPLAGTATALSLRRLYRLLANGSLTVDVGAGRRLQPLGPLDRTIGDRHENSSAGRPFGSHRAHATHASPPKFV